MKTEVPLLRSQTLDSIGQLGGLMIASSVRANGPPQNNRLASEQQARLRGLMIASSVRANGPPQNNRLASEQQARLRIICLHMAYNHT